MVAIRETVNRPASAVGCVIFPRGIRIPGSRGLVLRTVIIAETEVTEDGVVIRSRDLDEESFGPTLAEAYDDFLTSLWDRRASMHRRRERLSSADRSVLQKLDALLLRATDYDRLRGTIRRQACEYETSNEPSQGSLAQSATILGTTFISISPWKGPTTLWASSRIPGAET